jgi:hypothetical protein
MFSLERLLSIDVVEIPEVSKNLDSNEIKQLVEWLSEKDDKIRYQAFLLLKNRSISFDDVYLYWDVFSEKLKNENSYQRSLRLMLISENARWDKENKFERIMDDYLINLHYDKPITVRQCIQSLQNIIPYKEHLQFIIADRLMALDILSVKETMRKSILTDILEVLTMIRKYKTKDEIESYIFTALSGGILDKKSVKKIEAMMK